MREATLLLSTDAKHRLQAWRLLLPRQLPSPRDLQVRPLPGGSSRPLAAILQDVASAVVRVVVETQVHEEADRDGSCPTLAGIAMDDDDVFGVTY